MLPRDERGFTLIELLIVMLLITVLAAVALPTFLGKKDSAHDTEAKSSARNLMSQIDSCYVASQDFRKCATQDDNDADSLPWGSDPGEVSVADTTKDSYEIVAVSQSRSGSANHTFTIAREIGSPTERSCTGDSGCRSGTW
jgi:type IV pilus assembly protein PilA